MSIKLGNTDLNALNLGGVEINKAYLGAIEVFTASVFTSTWRTTGASETVQLPILASYTINWGDGNETTGDTSHEYLVADDYVVTILDTVTDWTTNNPSDDLKLINISNFGGLNIVTNAFFGNTNLDITSLDLPVCVSMSSALRGLTNLVFNSSIGLWDVSNVTNFNTAFRDSILFNQNINDWDVSNVTTFNAVFRGATSFDQPLNSWDFSSVTLLTNFMFGKTNANYSTANMDSLLNRLDDATFGLNFGIATNVNISFGTIDYTTAGATALASLISKGYIIAIGNEV